MIKVGCCWLACQKGEKKALASYIITLIMEGGGGQ